MSQHYFRDIDGYLVLDKPSGMSSNALLQKVRRLLGAKKAGHGGTLDPLATGVMLLCFGRATKVLSFILSDQKAYRVGFQLGVTTDTGDANGEVCERCSAEVTRAEVEKACEHFVGEISQVPPMYSALKHQGVPLYALARKGEAIERASRQVKIHRLALLKFDEITQRGEIDVVCSKGTYMRTLVEDLGKLLGCGAHVDALRRLASGDVNIESAYTLDTLLAHHDAEGFEGVLRCLSPAADLLHKYPKMVLDHAALLVLRHGKKAMPIQVDCHDTWLRLFNDEGDCVGLAWVNQTGRIEQVRWFQEILV